LTNQFIQRHQDLIEDVSRRQQEEDLRRKCQEMSDDVLSEIFENMSTMTNLSEFENNFIMIERNRRRDARLRNIDRGVAERASSDDAEQKEQQKSTAQD
jgi:hypothetical protein